MTFRVSLVSVILALALSATAHASPQRYAERLAVSAQSAQAESNCLVLRSIDLCGYRVRLISRATKIAAEVGGCRDRGCWYEFDGETRTTQFFCRGYMAFYPRAKRWYADQSISCYADDDPSWYFNGDGVLIREPVPT